jgi:hypothetical protein
MNSRKSSKTRARAARLAHEAELKAKRERRRWLIRARAVAAFVLAIAAGCERTDLENALHKLPARRPGCEVTDALAAGSDGPSQPDARSRPRLAAVLTEA